jgi:hypothetical protein
MSEIKRLVLTKKQKGEYKELSINSNIQAPYHAIKYHYDNHSGFFNPDIAGDNKKFFYTKFGKTDYTYDSWYRSYNWLVEFMGAVFTVSSSVRGTTYILVDVGENKDVHKLCYLFCLDMQKFLNS